MMSAGIPLHVALDNCTSHFPQENYRRLLSELATELRTGYRFSVAISRRPWFFSSFHRTLITVGEQTGGLNVVLRSLADYEESSRALGQELIAKLVYPGFLFLVSLTALILLPVFALDGLFQILENSNAELPWLTVAFIQTSRLIRSPLGWVLLLLAIVGLWILKSTWASSRRLREVVWIAMSRTPHLGPTLKATALARFARTFAIQLEAGVLMTKALPYAADATGSPVLTAQIGQATTMLGEGAPVHDACQVVPFLDQTFLSMLTVGEETGRLPELLRHLSRYYEQEAERYLETLASLLEPLVMCVMGVLFAVMLVATMLPLVRLVQTL
jgi:type IV pilus assembly protein PilC